MLDFEKYADTENVNSLHLPHPFLAKYLSKASGDQIKVLLAYQFLEKADTKVDTDAIADLLETTSKTVTKAIDFWIEEGIIHQEEEPVHTIIEDSFKKEEIMEEDSLVEQMIVIMEIGMGRNLTTHEVSVLSDIIHQYHFDFGLMSYLYEYCIIKKKGSFSYMKKVAESWHEKGFKTSAEAQAYVNGYGSISSMVSKAFGISNRILVDAEMSYVEKWLQEKYPEDFILEACNRTTLHTGKVSFQYADSILKKWSGQGVKTLEDIKAYDQIHQASKLVEEKAKKQPAKKSNSFHNFEQREYDYDALEAALLQKNNMK